jgi:membrane-bound lytic murein transglycosylase B
VKYGLDPAYIVDARPCADPRQHPHGDVASGRTKPWRDYRPIFISSSASTAAVPSWPSIAITSPVSGAVRRRGDHRYDRGVETSWGGNTGKTPVLDALYTLAFSTAHQPAGQGCAREPARLSSVTNSRS